MNWRRVVGALLLVAGLAAGVAPGAGAAPSDWELKTTWDLRPYGGVDYGLDAIGPGADLRAMIDAGTPWVNGTGGILTALGLKWSAPMTLAGVATNLTSARFEWCALGETAIIHIAAVARYEEKPGMRYTFWDRLLGRVEYVERHQWFVTGCSRRG